MLRLLVERAGRPVSSRDIYEEVWRESYASSSSNSVMVHIRHLRKKLAQVDSSETFIETAWGVGYRIESDAALRRNGADMRKLESAQAERPRPPPRCAPGRASSCVHGGVWRGSRLSEKFVIPDVAGSRGRGDVGLDVPRLGFLR